MVHQRSDDLKELFILNILQIYAGMIINLGRKQNEVPSKEQKIIKISPKNLVCAQSCSQRIKKSSCI